METKRKEALNRSGKAAGICSIAGIAISLLGLALEHFFGDKEYALFLILLMCNMAIAFTLYGQKKAGQREKREGGDEK